MNGGWPPDQQISFFADVESGWSGGRWRLLAGWLVGWMTGGQTCCWKNTRAAEASRSQISERWNWKQSSPLWNPGLVKLTSSAYCDLFDKVQAVCKTCFLYQEVQCSCIDIALMVEPCGVLGFGHSFLRDTLCAKWSWRLVLEAHKKPSLLRLPPPHFLPSMNSRSWVPLIWFKY